MISVRLSLRSACLLIVLNLAAAREPAIQTPVGGGATASGLGSAWAYPGEAGTCLEIRAAGRDSDRICGPRADNGGFWRPDAPPGKARFVAAIGDASAVGARVTFDDGTELGTSLMPGPEGSELRFFVIALEPDADPVRAELLDDSGLVLSTIALE